MPKILIFKLFWKHVFLSPSFSTCNLHSLKFLFLLLDHYLPPSQFLKHTLFLINHTLFFKTNHKRGRVLFFRLTWFWISTSSLFHYSSFFYDTPTTLCSFFFLFIRYSFFLSPLIFLLFVFLCYGSVIWVLQIDPCNYGLLQSLVL